MEGPTWFDIPPQRAGRLVNQRELARLLGIDPSTATEWSRRGLPVALRGERGAANSFDTAVAVRWAIRHRLQAAAPKSGPQERLARLRADALETEIEELRFNLYQPAEAAAAERQVTESARAISRGIADAFAQRNASGLSADDLIAELDDLVEAALAEMGAVDALQLLDDEAGPAAPGAAPAAPPPPSPRFDGELAALAGVDAATVAGWRADGLPTPADDAPPSDLAAVLGWAVDAEARRRFGESDRDRLAQLQGDKIELEIAERAGRLVAAAPFEDRLVRRIEATQEALRTMPARVAPLIVGLLGDPAAVAEVREHVEAAMRYLDDEAQ